MIQTLTDWRDLTRRRISSKPSDRFTKTLEMIITFSMKVYPQDIRFKSYFLPDCIPDPYWFIGLLTERRVRSKATDLTLIPLIQWEVQQDDGQWRELKAPKDPWYPEPFNTFTLNITIEHGK